MVGGRGMGVGCTEGGSLLKQFESKMFWFYRGNNVQISCVVTFLHHPSKFASVVEVSPFYVGSG